jgi:hypothetical protein
VKKVKKVWVVLYRYAGDVRYETDFVYERKKDALARITECKRLYVDIPHLVRSVEVPA